MHKLKQTILAVLRQGVTPDKLALTLVLGMALGTFPVLGSTTALCFGVALALRLNQPLIQLVNYFIYPVQLILYVPLLIAGGRWLDPNLPTLSLERIFEMFRADLLAAIRLLFWANLGAVGLWAIAALPLGLTAYFILRAVMRNFHSRLSTSEAAPQS